MENPGFKAKGKVKHTANSATSGYKNVNKSSSDDDNDLLVCHMFYQLDQKVTG